MRAVLLPQPPWSVPSLKQSLPPIRAARAFCNYTEVRSRGDVLTALIAFHIRVHSAFQTSSRFLPYLLRFSIFLLSCFGTLYSTSSYGRGMIDLFIYFYSFLRQWYPGSVLYWRRGTFVINQGLLQWSYWVCTSVIVQYWSSCRSVRAPSVELFPFYTIVQTELCKYCRFSYILHIQQLSGSKPHALPNTSFHEMLYSHKRIWFSGEINMASVSLV